MDFDEEDREAQGGFHRRSSFPKEFSYAGEDEDGKPIWNDEGSDEDIDLLYPGTPTLSEPDDDHHVATQAPRSHWDQDKLCAFCHHLPFDEVGFLPGGRYLVKSYEHTPRTFGDVEQASSSCILCSDLENAVRNYVGDCPEIELEDLSSKCEISYNIRKIGEWPTSPDGATGDLYQDHHLFRLSVTINLLPVDKYLYLTYQRCTDASLETGRRIDDTTPAAFADPSIMPCDGRLRPQEIDFRMVRWWLRRCSDQHGTQCTGNFTGSLPTHLRYVDIELNCIVDDAKDATYATLSYMWGAVPIPVLTTKNQALYQHPHHFNADSVPATLWDAMEVTRQLGIRYIWIDCLCILQDSDADKRIYIPQMDAIYGQSAITIVAAAGNVMTGLVGVRPMSRKPGPNPLYFGPLGLIRAQDTLRGNPVGGYAKITEWSTRAWTLQETLLSSRCLLFTEDQVYWACAKSSWCEDGWWELSESASAFRTALTTDRNPLPWTNEPDHVARVYGDLVTDFTGRKLSFESDAGNACTGILNALQRACGQEIFWGLLTQSLERSLDWTAFRFRTGEISSIRRRYDEELKKVATFPSWSWQAWKGRIEPEGFVSLEEGSFPPEKFSTIGLIFYRITANRELARLPQAQELTPTIVKSFFGKTDEDNVARMDFGVEEIASIPESVPRSMILCFWTDTLAANFYAGENADLYDCRLEIREESSEGFVFNGFNIASNGTPGSPGDLIVIGRRPLRIPDELAVLFVSWENGVAYRRGSLTVARVTWLSVKDRVWKPIFLA